MWRTAGSRSTWTSRPCLLKLQPKVEAPAQDECRQQTKEGSARPGQMPASGAEASDLAIDPAQDGVAGAPATAAEDTSESWLRAEAQSGQPAVYVLAAAASSGQGDYAATPFTGSSDYQLSLAVGAMQTSYAVPLPPTAGGLAPDVTLRYDSGSVDGMTINKNNQPGWVGIGWHYEPGAITGGSRPATRPEAPEDLCLTGDNYTIALNGVASPW